MVKMETKEPLCDHGQPGYTGKRSPHGANAAKQKIEFLHIIHTTGTAANATQATGTAAGATQATGTADDGH